MTAETTDGRSKRRRLLVLVGVGLAVLTLVIAAVIANGRTASTGAEAPSAPATTESAPASATASESVTAAPSSASPLPTPPPTFQFTTSCTDGKGGTAVVRSTVRQPCPAGYWEVGTRTTTTTTAKVTTRTTTRATSSTAVSTAFPTRSQPTGSLEGFERPIGVEATVIACSPAATLNFYTVTATFTLVGGNYAGYRYSYGNPQTKEIHGADWGGGKLISYFGKVDVDFYSMDGRDIWIAMGSYPVEVTYAC